MKEIERRDGDKWVPCEFEELRVGDMFRVVNDPVLAAEDMWRCASNPVPMPDQPGNWGMQVDLIPPTPTKPAPPPDRLIREHTDPLKKKSNIVAYQGLPALPLDAPHTLIGSVLHLRRALRVLFGRILQAFRETLWRRANK